MTNNVNNLNNGFNAVNFKGKGEKPKQEAKRCECDCPSCIEPEATAADALESMGRAQISKPYKFDPEAIKDDLNELGEAETEALKEYFRQSMYHALVYEEGVDPDRAYELADTAARCLNPNV